MTDRLFMEQYLRIKRYFKRFEDITLGLNHDRDTEYHLDDVYSFFINCYHLKDWLENDPTTNISGTFTRKYIDGSENLKVCQDICNGMKHLNFKNRSGIVSKDYKFTLGNGAFELKMKFWIDVNGKKVDAFDVASGCLKEWNEFLQKKIDNFHPKL